MRFELIIQAEPGYMGQPSEVLVTCVYDRITLDDCVKLGKNLVELFESHLKDDYPNSTLKHSLEPVMDRPPHNPSK